MNSCVVCKTNRAWRIKLRGAEHEDDDDKSCGHVVCVNCALIHLKKWILKDKPRIKCPAKGCLKRIHENDIRALLDDGNGDLDMYMPKETRARLQHLHDFGIISYALGEENVRVCPRCKNIYGKKLGCNYVRCPNLVCNTWFCWQCGDIDVSWAHFILGSTCSANWDDVLKGLYFVHFLLFAGGCTLLYLSLPIFLGLFVYSPLVITFGTPLCILNSLKRQWRPIGRGEGGSNSQGRICMFAAMRVALYILFLPIGSLVGAISLLGSLLLFMIFNVLLFIKLIPIVGQIIFLLEIIQCITGCFGYGNWLQRYKKSKEQKESEKRATRQFRKEGSERLVNPNVGR